MIEYLKQLTKDQQWETALSYAEQLTADSTRTIPELVEIYSAIMRARFALSEYPGAVVAGELAMNLAREIGDWSAYGTVCSTLGATLITLKEHDRAIAHLAGYLRDAHQFNPPSDLHSNIWYNLSLAYKALGRGTDAVLALTNALTHAIATSDAYRIHAMIIALMDARLKVGDVREMPRLLAQSGKYLRQQPPEMAQERILYHLLYRVEYALQSGRLRRANILAAKGLSISEGRPRHRCRFHMLLAEINRKSNSRNEALDHAFSARAYADACQRPDLQAESALIIERLLA